MASRREVTAMPNLVEITIKADDETGGAFASVLAKYYAMKNAMRGGIVLGGAEENPGAVTSTLVNIKQKMQSLGVADIADVNVQPGMIYQRMLFIKRVMQQVGLGDLLGVGARTLPIMGPFQTFSFGQGPVSDIHNNFIGAGGGGRGDKGGGGGIGGFFGGLAGAAGGGLNAVANNNLFGGAGIGWLTGIGGIAGWHVLTDLIVEGLISIGTAALAAGAGIAALGPTFGNINDHLQAVNSVSKALGQNIPPLSTDFQKLTTAMAPRAIELYGAGINIVNNALKNTGPGVGQVVNLFDTWAAKLVNWSNAQQGFGFILKTGTGYLSQFGTLLGTLGNAFSNMLHDDPGIARYLLDILQAVAQLVNQFSMLPAPVVEAALALHGVYLWGKVLGAILGIMSANLAKATINMLSFVASAKFAPSLVGAVALVVYELAKSLDQGTPAIQAFANALNDQLGSMKPSQAIYGNVQALNALQAQIKLVDDQFEKSQFANLGLWQQVKVATGVIGINIGRTFQDFIHGNFAGAIAGLHNTLALLANNTNVGLNILKDTDISRLNSMINEVLGSEKNLFGTTGMLIKQGYSFQQALGLMDLAGIKQSDTLDVMKTKVNNLITGYKNMGVQGGILENSVNATTFAVMMQDSHVQNLIAGWDAFFSVVSGGVGGMQSFAQALQSMQQGAANGGNFSDLTGSSLTNQQNFLQTASAAQKEQDAILNLVAASGLGKRGTDLLTDATKNMLATMLPAASQSQQLTTILYALAQQGGYQGADSFQALSKWVGNTHNPLTNLYGDVTALTVAAGTLNTDIQNLSTALGTTLTSAMSKAIFLASGGEKPFDNFASAVLTAHGNTRKMTGSADTLIGELKKLDPTHAKNLFFSFGMMLGLNKTQLQELWQHQLPKTQKAIDSLHGKTVSINIDISQAMSAVNTVIGAVNALSSMYTSVPGYPFHAMGGITAAATGGPRGGLVTVGEHGKELVRLPGGSHVLPGTDAYMGGGGGGWEIRLTADKSFAKNLGITRDQVEAIKAVVQRIGGGGTDSVQRTFGQRW